MHSRLAAEVRLLGRAPHPAQDDRHHHAGDEEHPYAVNGYFQVVWGRGDLLFSHRSWIADHRGGTDKQATELGPRTDASWHNYRKSKGHSHSQGTMGLPTAQRCRRHGLWACRARLLNSGLLDLPLGPRWSLITILSGPPES